MFNKTGVLFQSGMFAMLCSLPLMADGMKMPMRFTDEASPEQVLKTYPLDSLKKLAVMSHHGKADKEVRLANGHEGWVYSIGKHRTLKTYVAPNGEKKTVIESLSGDIDRSYTLVFDDDGQVIDVLYQGELSSMSALQLQSKPMISQ